MSHLEHLISRYLDGELTPGELRELHRRLDRSPEARALLREMTAVTRSARSIPSLDAPSRGLESRLFHRLHAEGLGQSARPVASAAAAHGAAGVRSRSFGRPTAALLLLVLFALTTSYWLSNDVGPVGGAIAEGTVSAPAAQSPGTPPSSPSAPRLSSSGDRLTVQIPVARREGSSAVNRRNGSRERVEDGRRNIRNDLPVVPEQTLIDQLNPDPLPYDSPNPIAQTPEMQTPRDPLIDIPPVDMMPEPPPAPGRESVLAASFRPTGFSFGSDGATPDLSVRIDARVGDGHQVSFIVGRSALRAEQSATALIASSPAVAASNGSGNYGGSRNVTADKSGTSEEASTTIELENETWGGVGYSYTFGRIGRLELAAGVRAGAGSKSMRFGAEGSVRYSISDVVAFECVPTISHVVPHDQSTTPITLEDRSTGTLSFGQSKHSTFTSTGVELGVRISIR